MHQIHSLAMIPVFLCKLSSGSRFSSFYESRQAFFEFNFAAYRREREPMHGERKFVRREGMRLRAVVV